MSQHRHASITEDAISRLANCPDARLKQLMTALIARLHDFILEVELTDQEWLAAINFLTQTGQACTEQRQEFILLSDTLGASMLMVALAQQRRGGTPVEEMEATDASVQGPYYREGVPELPLGTNLAEGVSGEPTLYYGRVTDVSGQPIAGALLDVWSGDGEGQYDLQAEEEEAMHTRGRLRTDHEGRYWFWSIRPSCYSVPHDGPVGRMLAKLGRHPYRPGHIHLIVSADGHLPVTTVLFVANSPYLDSDVVFGVKDSLVVEFEPHPPGVAFDGRVMTEAFHAAHYDFRLVPMRH